MGIARSFTGMGPDRQLTLEFARLCLLSTVVAWLLGNLLLVDAAVFQLSTRLLLVILLFQLSLFCTAHMVSSLPAAIAIVLSLVAAVAFIGSPWYRWSLTALAIVAATAYLFVLARRDDLRAIPLLKSSLVGGLVIISAKSPVSFDLLDRVVQGTVHRDTLFHASIAAMIKQYGTVSTGLNGLVETPYHVLSHMLVASLSHISGTGVIEIYGLLPLLLLPLLITLYAFIARRLDASLSSYRAFALVALLLALVPRVLKTWGLKESYFGSESFALSLIVLAAVLLVLLRERTYKSDHVLLLALAVLAAAAKATIGVAVIGLCAVKAIFFSGDRRTVLQMSATVVLMTALVYAVVAASISGNVGGEQVMYWEYVRGNSLLGDMIADGWMAALLPLSMFLAFHFLPNWIVVRWRLRQADAGRPRDDPAIVYNLAAVAAAVVIVMLPLVSGSAAYYFSGAAMFVALPWLVVLLGRWRPRSLKYPFVTAVILVLLFKGGKLMDKSALRRSADIDASHAAFVEQLIELRQRRDGSLMLRRNPQNPLHSANPVMLCDFRPFVYPALTEIAWLDVIFERCDYYQYGYAHYLDTAGDDLTSIRRKVPAGTQIESW